MFKSLARMRTTKLATIVLLAAFGPYCFGQRIVDQTVIDPNEQVFLNEPMSIFAFDDVFEIGEVFPDFETVSTENAVFNLEQILETAASEMRVPVFVAGRPSCNLMRDAYEYMVLPAVEQNPDDIRVYQLAISIETHATNGYETPYYAFLDSQFVASPQTVPFNDGYEFYQPFTGQELIDRTSEFVSKMVETEVGTEADFADVTVLLDDPAGGFTGAFGGPAIVWVLNPLTGTVVYERTHFLLTCQPEDTIGHEAECAELQAELLETVAEVKQMMLLVGVESIGMPNDAIELKWFNISGQRGTGQYRVFYDPLTRQKFIRPAQ